MPDPTPDTDPLAVRCCACLAAPGEPCIGTTSNLPRERPHRLRPLAAHPRLIRCTDCAGSGWRDASPRLAPQVTCPVCGAAPAASCTEGGAKRRDLHTVRRRAARAGLEACPSCDAVGWVPDEPTPRPDVPDEAIAAFCHAFWGASPAELAPGLVEQARTTLAAVLPEIERRALRNAADALLTTGSHSDLCQLGPPGTCDCPLGEHYRWLIARSEGETHDAP